MRPVLPTGLKVGRFGWMQKIHFTYHSLQQEVNLAKFKELYLIDKVSFIGWPLPKAITNAHSDDSLKACKIGI